MADGTALRGYWLPELPGLELEVHERAFGPGHVPLRIPTLTPHTVREILVALKGSRAEFLAGRPVADILTAIDAAARRLTEPGEELYDELVSTLPDLTGYSKRMIEIGLERMGAGWTADALRGALDGEFGSLDVLDDFRPRKPRGFQRAFGAALTVHIFSGNIPGVSVTSLIRGLCVKSAGFGKTAAGEPYFAVCFARALAAEAPEIASCLAVSYWPGGSEDLEAVAFSEAGAVIAYGGDEAVSQVGCRVPPGVRFIGYPNRVGAALVANSALSRVDAPLLARNAALDVVMFDQQGCVSPHTIYVQRGGEIEPLEFANQLAAALHDLSAEIPRGTLAPGESSLIHQLRAQAEMRGATVLVSERGTEWTVIVEDRVEFEPSPLNRVIQVRPVDDLSEAVSALGQVGSRMQTVAIAAEPNEVRSLAARLGAIGATRLVRVGEAAWPAPHWHHDGRFQFMDLVRFVDLEAD
ncbi:MAG: acyl-CoA reductase [Gemmatimonadota bacterium]